MQIKENMSSWEIARNAVKILLEKKGLEVRMFDVTESSSITDYFVNATGRSSLQVGALADYVADGLSELGVSALRIEGRRTNSWVLVDFGDCIVNIFDKESRSFYSFDRHLVNDKEIDISDIVTEVDKSLEI